MTIPGLAVLIMVVAFAEVTYRKVTGRTGLPWMRNDDGDRRAAAIGFEEFDAIFAAGKRAEFEQRQSTLMHKDNPGDGADGFDVDLTAGKIHLHKP